MNISLKELKKVKLVFDELLWEYSVILERQKSCTNPKDKVKYERDIAILKENIKFLGYSLFFMIKE